MGCDWAGLAEAFAWLLPAAADMEDSEGFLSPPLKLEDGGAFLATEEPWERGDCLEGTLPDEGQGFLGMTPLKLPAGFSGGLVSDVLE